ncbi:glutaredoxin domain-containing protein [Nonomuraea jiangxiensis]|uniref:Mycoredoxin n=1 Tax=Nonomuraea jiangxiensis TaxID=633440 RepID=A0A1G7ZZW2_9ACTN|nr:glutaredoxin domain-containing protein [Nonomuraea jiangxiensis]SDH14215.1 mycoredoxin [Nonomuraea jiangxiensis]
MMRSWTLPILFVVAGVLMAVAVTDTGVPFLVAFVLLAGLNSPLMFPRSIAATEARRRSALDGRPIVYWRPGCKYCIRLRIRLGRDARRLHWVNIWRDPDGAAEVRAANNGNETVPTVVTAGRPHVNPTPDWVRGQLPPST